MKMEKRYQKEEVAKTVTVTAHRMIILDLSSSNQVFLSEEQIPVANWRTLLFKMPCSFILKNLQQEKKQFTALIVDVCYPGQLKILAS